MTEHLEDLTTRIRPRVASNILLWSVIGLFFIIITWAALTKIDRTVYSDGRVVPTAQLQVVSNLEGGVVSEILAKPGAPVKSGTPLLRLDQTLSGADLSTTSSAIGSMSVKLARLEAEILGHPPRFPVSTDPAIAEQVTIETALYRSRQADLASLTEAGRARTLQAERGIAEAEANRSAAAAAREAAELNVNSLRPLVREGIEPQLNLVQAERQLMIGRSQVASAQAATARARASVAEARAALSQQQQAWRAQAADELAKVQAELSARRQTLPALRDKVQRTVVRAPMDGRVNRVLVSTVGGTVRPGEPLVEIVPSNSGLTVEAAVRPSDIAFVRPGQRALIKISAYDYGVYGGLEGRVIGISPDAIVNERTGETHYLVRIRTSKDHLEADGVRLPVTPGMVATANLIGDKRSVLSYWLTPFTRMSESAFRER